MYRLLLRCVSRPVATLARSPVRFSYATPVTRTSPTLSNRLFSTSLARRSNAEETPHVQIEPRLSLTFTCSVKNCGHRSTHEFSKKSYEKGIVIVQCPECKNRHLIADHLGWFKETEGAEGPGRTIEDFMRAKGIKVQRGRMGHDGDVEYYVDEQESV